MTRPRTAHRVAAATGCALALLLAGCSTDSTAKPEVSSEKKAELFSEQCENAVVPELPDLKPVDGVEGTAKVATDFGEVELPTDPQAALGMYTTDVDMLIWLHYPLAAQQPIRGDSGYQTFPCFFPYDALKDTGTFANYPDFNYEEILATEPDFVLNGLGYDKKVVKRLADIAPTYSVDAFDGQSWMVHFQETAKALGREKYYDEWKSLYDERLAEVKSEIGDTEGLVVAPVGAWDADIWSSCYSGVECQVFDDLGLSILPGARDNDGEGLQLSGEQVGRLADIDYAFMIKGLGKKGETEFDTMLAELGKNKLWSDLEFVKKDQIVGYEMEMTYGSPSGQLAFLEVVRKALGDR